MSLTANIRKLYAFSFLKMTLFPMAIITLFWKDQIGLTLTEILFLQGLFSLATLLLEYPSGYLSDRLGYRFSLNFAALLGILGWGLYLVADSFAGVLVAELLLGASFAFISGSDSALLFETLSREQNEERYAEIEGRMLGYAQLGEAAGAIFAGTLYATLPLLPFIIQVGIWVLILVLTLTLREPPRSSPIRTGSHLAEAWGIVRYTFGENRRLRTTLILSVFLGLASFYPVWLIQPFMQETGVPLDWFGPVWAGANAIVALFSWLSYRFHFWLGARGMVTLFFALIICAYAGLSTTHSQWSFLFYYLLTAMRGLQGPLLKTLIQQDSRSGTRASILSLKSLSFRLLFFCTAPLAGMAGDLFGLNIAFALIGGLLSLGLALSIYKFNKI